MRGRRAKVALLLVVALGSLAACSDDQEPAQSDAENLAGRDYGPLAVVDFPNDDDGASLASGGDGVLEVSGTCVALRLSSGRRVVPVWRADDVVWDSQNNAIIFSDSVGGETAELHDGDTLAIGGESLWGDVPMPDRVVPWVQRPAKDCRGHRFAVHLIDQGAG